MKPNESLAAALGIGYGLWVGSHTKHPEFFTIWSCIVIAVAFFAMLCALERFNRWATPRLARWLYSVLAR